MASAASDVGRLVGPRGVGRAPTTHAGVGAAIPAGVPIPARRAPRTRRRPPNAAVECAPRYGGVIRPHAAALAARHAHGRTTLGLRDRPTTRFSSAAGRIDGARRATARDGVHNNAPWFAAAPAASAASAVGRHDWQRGGGRAPTAHAGGTRGDYGRRHRAGGPPRAAPDGARPTQPSRNAPRSRGAIRPTLRRWRRSTRMPGSVRVEGPPNDPLQLRRWQLSLIEASDGRPQP